MIISHIMYKVPEDSFNDDDFVPKSYFEKRKDIKLDETIRNHGKISDTPESKKAFETSSKSSYHAPDKSKQNPTEPLPTDSKTAETTENSISEFSANESIKNAKSVSSTNETVQNPTSLSEAFAFIKDTEFYDKEEIDKILEEKRKRKLEKEPSSSTDAGSSSKSSHDLNSSSVLKVSTRQRGNPLLSHIRNVALTYSDTILPDYVMGASTCALFLSLKYHRLHPDYIYERLRKLGSGFTVRVLLLLVDIPDSAACVQELTKVALLSNCTLLLSWSCVEAARYIESFKIYEHKPAEVLQGFKDTSYQGYLQNFLTSIRGVNKTDVIRLKSEFGTAKNICNTDKNKLSSVPGIGTKKAARLYDIFNTPFKSNP